MVGYLADILAANTLSPTLLVEPFAGGASVSLQLLADGVVDSIGLVDRDPRIAAFWRVVFFDTDWLVEQVRSVDLDLDTWRRFKHDAAQTDRERALACLYLNRTSFSGILAPRAGPIGGTRGPFDPSYFACRFPRETLERRIRMLEKLRDRVRFVWCLDWRQALGRIREMQRRSTLPEQVTYYVDPPFFDKAERLYTYHFKASDHRRLRDVLVAMDPSDEPWILSYDSLPRVRDLYGTDGHQVVTIERFYTASRLLGRHPLFAEAVVTNLPICPPARRLVSK
jgi:DNA adenine methylase